jgi:hypothetical protein
MAFMVNWFLNVECYMLGLIRVLDVSVVSEQMLQLIC